MTLSQHCHDTITTHIAPATWKHPNERRRTNQSAPISIICCASSARLARSHDKSDGAMSDGQLYFIVLTYIFLLRYQCRQSIYCMIGKRCNIHKMLDSNHQRPGLYLIRLEVEEVASKNEVRSPKQTHQYRVTYSLRQIPVPVTKTTADTDQTSRSFWLQVRTVES